MRKMLASQMKGVPQADQDKVFNMLQKNPELFQKIAMEVQAEIKKGKVIHYGSVGSDCGPEEELIYEKGLSGFKIKNGKVIQDCC